MHFFKLKITEAHNCNFYPRKGFPHHKTEKQHITLDYWIISWKIFIFSTAILYFCHLRGNSTQDSWGHIGEQYMAINYKARPNFSADTQISSLSVQSIRINVKWHQKNDIFICTSQNILPIHLLESSFDIIFWGYQWDALQCKQSCYNYVEVILQIATKWLD